MEYDIISTPDLEELCLWVNEKLRQGWRLQGGIATVAEKIYGFLPGDCPRKKKESFTKLIIMFLS